MRVRHASDQNQLAQALGIAPRAAVHLIETDLDLAVWRQRDRFYEVPPLLDPVISIHVGGAGRVRFGDGDGWSRRSTTLGTVTFIPPGVGSRWLVENGEVEHLSITTGPGSRLRTVVTGAADCIEVGLPDSLNVSLAQTMVEVLTQDNVGDEGSTQFLGSLCEALVRHFARVHRIRYRGTPLGAAAGGITQRAIAAIEARFAETLTVNQLAAEAGLSTAYFSAVFKRATGLSPHQYLLQVRIERVREALKSTDLAVAEIALNFGFSSQSHLNAAFRRMLGITPAQYRTR